MERSRKMSLLQHVYDLTDTHSLYEVLGAARDADEGRIKRAYHKMAMQYHPDKNPGGADMFKAINFAYTILSDVEQRVRYDKGTLKQFIRASEGGGGGKGPVDPEMDPNVELSQEALLNFVERLKKQHRDTEEKHREFERQKEAELARRAEFDRVHPHFKMPDLEIIPQHRHHHGSAAGSLPPPPPSHVYMPDRLSSDTTELLNRASQLRRVSLEDELTSRAAKGGAQSSDQADTQPPPQPSYHHWPHHPHQDDSVGPHVSHHHRQRGAPKPREHGGDNFNENDAPTTSTAAAPLSNPHGGGGMMSAKDRMLLQFRERREATGQKPTAVVLPSISPRQASSIKKKIGVYEADEPPHYDYDASSIKAKRGNFDYCSFVSRSYNDGGVIREAILADALNRYD